MDINRETRQFFDTTGLVLGRHSWCNLYQAYYFLNGPKYGRKINSGNQTSPYVEAEAIRILNQTHPLSHHDLKFIFGWKLGQINHRASQEKQQVIYKLSWDQQLVARMRFKDPDFSSAVSWLTHNMPQILALQPAAIFDLHRDLTDVGPVYILTLLFFLSHGLWPIYDKYAAIAVDAITRGAAPGSTVQVSQLSSWNRYQAFAKKISFIFGRQDISRKEDRALWAYGHFFEVQQPKANGPV